MTYPEALRALNNAAWDAVYASKGIVTDENPDYQALRVLCRETDRLVDELAAAEAKPLSDLGAKVFAVANAERDRVLSHLGGEVPALRSAVKGATSHG